MTKKKTLNRLSAQQERTVCRLLTKGRSLRAIAEEFGISHTAVRNIGTRRGAKIRSLKQASKARAVYPKDWRCRCCGKTRKAKNYTEFRRKYCSQKCRFPTA